VARAWDENGNPVDTAPKAWDANGNPVQTGVAPTTPPPDTGGLPPGTVTKYWDGKAHSVPGPDAELQGPGSAALLPLGAGMAVAPLRTAASYALGAAASKIPAAVASLTGSDYLEQHPNVNKALETGAAVAGAVAGDRGMSALGRSVAEGLANSALGTTAKTRQWGTNPGKQVLAETNGVTMPNVTQSARERLGQIGDVKQAQIDQAPPVSLDGPRATLQQAWAKAVKEKNGALADQLKPMISSLYVDPFTGQEIPSSIPAGEAYDLLHGFKDQHTNFVEGRTNAANDTAKATWASLRNAIREAAPDTAALDERMQNLIPARDLAVKAGNKAGMVETGVDRATRPTGGLAATLFGLHEAGVPGAAAAMAIQEGLSSPPGKMALARALYGGVGGPKIAAPEMPQQRIAAPPDTSGPVPPEVRDFRNATAGFRDQKQLPAASSQIGVSGTTVPDATAFRAPRNTGGQNLLLPPVPGEPPLNVSGPSSREVVGENPNPWPPRGATEKMLSPEVLSRRGAAVPSQQGIAPDLASPGGLRLVLRNGQPYWRDSSGAESPALPPVNRSAGPPPIPPQ